MLQSGYKFDVREKKSFPPLPEDMYQVELFDIDMESVPDKNNPGQMQQVLKFQFVVLDDGEFEAEGQKLKVRGRSIWRNFVPTYLWKKGNEKNALYQITKAIIMRDLTEAEIGNFTSDFINKLIGYQCRVTTLNVAGKGKTADQIYTNIDKFLPKKVTVAGLTQDEKEKARTKKDDSVSETAFPQPTAPVAEEEIPVIDPVQQVVETMGGKIVEESKEEIKIEDVPF